MQASRPATGMSKSRFPSEAFTCFTGFFDAACNARKNERGIGNPASGLCCRIQPLLRCRLPGLPLGCHNHGFPLRPSPASRVSSTLPATQERMREELATLQALASAASSPLFDAGTGSCTQGAWLTVQRRPPACDCAATAPRQTFAPQAPRKEPGHRPLAPQ